MYMTALKYSHTNIAPKIFIANCLEISGNITKCLPNPKSISHNISRIAWKEAACPPELVPTWVLITFSNSHLMSSI